MDSKEFIEICKAELVIYHNRELLIAYNKESQNGENPQLPKYISHRDVYVVLYAKVSQNNKALLVTNQPDGLYYEMTYNGDKKQLYLDEYVKKQNIMINIQ